MAAVIKLFPSNIEDWVGHISRSGKIDLSEFQKDMKADWFQALVKGASPGQALDTFSSMFGFNILPKEHHTEAFIALIQAPFFPDLVNARIPQVGRMCHKIIAYLPEEERLRALAAVLESDWFDDHLVRKAPRVAAFMIENLTNKHPDQEEFYRQHQIVKITGQDSEGIVVVDPEYVGILIVRPNAILYQFDYRSGCFDKMINSNDEYTSGEQWNLAREEITRKLGSLASTFQVASDPRAALCGQVVARINALNSVSAPSLACAR